MLALGIEERVGARVRVAVGVDERARELLRALLRPRPERQVAERVPPPLGVTAAGDSGRVEVPHRPVPLADQAGCDVQVGLVRGAERGRGRGRQRRDRHSDALQPPRPADAQLHLLPGGVQQDVAEHAPRDGQAGRAHPEPLRHPGRASLAHRPQLPGGGEQPRGAVDVLVAGAGAWPAAQPPAGRDGPDHGHQGQERGHGEDRRVRELALAGGQLRRRDQRVPRGAAHPVQAGGELHADGRDGHGQQKDDGGELERRVREPGPVPCREVCRLIYTATFPLVLSRGPEPRFQAVEVSWMRARRSAWVSATCSGIPGREPSLSRNLPRPGGSP